MSAYYTPSQDIHILEANPRILLLPQGWTKVEANVQQLWNLPKIKVTPHISAYIKNAMKIIGSSKLSNAGIIVGRLPQK
jgi:hypothetical protein